MKRKKEGVFQSQIINSGKIIYKDRITIRNIPDSYIVVNKKKIAAPKPYDAYGWVDGKPFVFEFKREEGKKMRFGKISKNQHEGMSEAIKSGANAYIVCHFPQERIACYINYYNLKINGLVPDSINTLSRLKIDNKSYYDLRKILGD